MHNMNIVHSDGDLCNHDIAKLPTYRGGRRTDNKLSKLFKIIYLASIILLSTLARIFAKLALMKKNREVSAWSYNSSMVSAGR